jgi:surface protein
MNLQAKFGEQEMKINAPFKNITVVESVKPVYQEKTVTPTEEEQRVVADAGFDAIEVVNVKPIPSEYSKTSDATAIEEDILSGKTAYISNGKVTGTFSLDEEITTQTELIEQISETLNAVKPKTFALMRKLLPDEYQEVEYIESTGTQYIDTGKTINTATDTVELVFQNNEPNTYKWFFGEHDNNARLGLGSGDGEGKRNVAYGNSTYKVADSLQYFGKHIFVANQDGVFIDETKIANYSSFSSTSTLYLFNLNLSGGNYVSKSKIWRYIHTRNGEDIVNLIPCYRKSDKAVGMYDLVSNEFFSNAGTGEFLYKNLSSSYNTELQTNNNKLQVILDTANSLPEYEEPSGEIEITENGSFDVKDYAVANVNVQAEVDDTLKTFLDSTKSTYYLFYNYAGTSVEGLIPYSATENVTNMSAMFRSCTKLTKAPLYDTRNVTNMNSMFYGCTALTEVPSFDTSNVKNIGSMFYGCTSLIVAPALNTKNATDMSSMFRNCSKLKSVKFVKADSATSFSYCFDGCTSLELVDFRGASFYPSMSSTTAFRDVPSSCKVVIPDRLYDKWTNATNWSAINVIYVKESEYSIEQGEAISFTIDGVTYQATKDMIWYDWAKSDFNTAGFYCQSDFGYVSLSGSGVSIHHNKTRVAGVDIIIENGEYQTK